MRIFLAILGFIVGNLLGIAILAMITTASNSEMGSPFILATISGIICAIIGYKKKKKQGEK